MEKKIVGARKESVVELRIRNIYIRKAGQITEILKARRRSRDCINQLGFSIELNLFASFVKFLRPWDLEWQALKAALCSGLRF